MARFNIEVNLDWVDEEGNIDDTLKEEITSAIVSKISLNAMSGVEKQVNEIVNGKIEKDVSEKLNALMEDFFDKPRTITDQWGDTVKTDISVIDLLKKSCENFINATVDESGKTVSGSYYGKTKKRIDYIVESKIDYNMKSAIDRAAEEFKKKLVAYVNESVRTRIGESVAKMAGLDDVLGAMK